MCIYYIYTHLRICNSFSWWGGMAHSTTIAQQLTHCHDRLLFLERATGQNTKENIERQSLKSKLLLSTLHSHCFSQLRSYHLLAPKMLCYSTSCRRNVLFSIGTVTRRNVLTSQIHSEPCVTCAITLATILCSVCVRNRNIS